MEKRYYAELPELPTEIGDAREHMLHSEEYDLSLAFYHEAHGCMECYHPGMKLWHIYRGLRDTAWSFDETLGQSCSVWIFAYHRETDIKYSLPMGVLSDYRRTRTVRPLKPVERISNWKTEGF